MAPNSKNGQGMRITEFVGTEARVTRYASQRDECELCEEEWQYRRPHRHPGDIIAVPSATEPDLWYYLKWNGLVREYQCPCPGRQYHNKCDHIGRAHTLLLYELRSAKS